MINVGIIGATGYAGAELIRILLSHKQVNISAVSSVSFAGSVYSDIYPAFRGIFDQKCGNSDFVTGNADIVFAAVPHGLSEDIAEKVLQNSGRLIDLGADFRLESEDDYTAWYGPPYSKKSLHDLSVYGLPELYRDKIPGAKIVANPGCYPTSIALGLAPVLRHGLAVPEQGIICDSKSGVSGAGRGLAQNLHFVECDGSFCSYKTAAHRHTPEIEQVLSDVCGSPVTVTFAPHLLPVTRGILSTCYVRLKAQVSEKTVRDAYETAYENEPFVRLLPSGANANIKAVRYSNLCDISLHTDLRTHTLIVTSAIDNMVKGAAGQAIQNMNLLCGFPETSGLLGVPPAF